MAIEPESPAWKALAATDYLAAATQLVHFSAKTVNTNARPGGIRLGPADALDLPYVSGRTCMAAGVRLELDYIANSGTIASAVRQLRLGAAEARTRNASAEEVAAIEQINHAAMRERLEVGLEPVDARLRQVLIPKPSAPGGYVSLTPITSGGVCELLLGKNGLVARHSALRDAEHLEVKEVAKRKLVAIPRVVLGIGGANSQNVGGLVRAMQRPILVRSPRAPLTLRKALRIYHQGIELPSLLIDARALSDFREAAAASDGSIRSTLQTRQRERELLDAALCKVLEAGEVALDILRANSSQLPAQHPVPDTGHHELVSRTVPSDIRGLIDPDLREPDWSARIAARIMEALSVTTKSKGVEVAVYSLDAAGWAATLKLVQDLADARSNRRNANPVGSAG